jgi:cytochrome c1
MAAWIADPKKLRADASMPRVFHSTTGSEAADVAAYLATLGKPAGAAAEADDEAVTQGSQLFAGLGCIGCHTKPDAEAADKEGARLPLANVNAKFQPAALRAWLVNPQAHYPAARMPNFHLTDFEADRLVAYLVKNAKEEVAANDKGDAAKGRALFASAGCANCHKMKDVSGGLATKAMPDLLASSDWTKGCMAETVAGTAPDFALSAEQRGALMAIAAAGLSSLNNDVLPELAERSVRRLQCLACHARDEVEDRWSTVAEEVADMAPPETNIESDQTGDAAKGPRLFLPRGLGKLHGGDQIVISGDQTRPALTWTGEKLRPEWAARFIDGELTYKPRYWLRARMPAFTGRGQAIAQGLALEHGFAPQSALPGGKEAPPKPDLAAIGQKLVSRDGGFACITCHSIVDTKAISPFEAPAPNFVHATTRLTHDYYLRWMRKPMRFQPGTKMPQFSEDGKTTLKEILEGDADKQFEAIWNYLLQGEGMTPPE